jgi:hypothetical protein
LVLVELEDTDQTLKLVDPFLEENPDDIGLLCVLKKVYEKSDNEESAVYYEELLKEYRQNIVYFLLDNNNSIRVDDFKIYEPIYKCYREKGNCLICSRLSNIICTNCCNNYNDKEI